MRWGGLERNRQGIGRDFQIVQRPGFERHRNIVLGKLRRAQGFRKFRIERCALSRWRDGGGLCACHGGVGRRRILGRGRGLGGRRCRRLGRDSDKAIALQGAIDLGEIGRVITRRRLRKRIPRHRTGDADTLVVEAGQPIACGLRRRRPDRTAEAIGSDLNGAGGGEHPFLPAFGDARLPGQQRCDILISNLVRDQCEDAETKTEGRETHVLRPVTQL